MYELDIFTAARELADPEERARYLDEMCEPYPGLRERIDSLLKNAAGASQFLETPAAQFTGQMQTRASNSNAGSATPSDRDRTQFELESDSINIDFLAPSDDPAMLGSIGHYNVTDVIGRGGMGIVFKARDTRLHRIVAIKVLSPELAANPAARKRFLREAQAAAAVVHDHIVTIHAVEDGPPPCLVMEMIDGQSLQEKLDEEGPLELKEILRIGRQVAAGLAAAHSQGLIHRDVKPANILLKNGIQRVQITDFGLARAVDDVGLTHAGQITGTPQYMSPEQAQGKSVDQRSDLFSLGSVLYAMCTGHSPFGAETTMGALRRVCDESPRPIRELNPDIPDWFAAISNRLLAKSADERFQTATEVEKLLSHHLAELQSPSATAFPAVSLQTGSRHARLSRRSIVTAIIVCGVLASLGVAEGTGVTDFVSTVLRITAPEGTLIVEVDDPLVNVTIEGDGGLVITGAGARSVRLKPGSYKLQAKKDNQPIRTELLTIARGDTKVVSISVEPRPLATTAQSVSGLVRIFAHPPADYVDCVALSPDGQRLLSTGSIASGQPACFIWDIATGRELRRLKGHTSVIRSAAFAPDSRQALSGSQDGMVRLWDVETGQELHHLECPGQVCSVTWSPDGQQALFGNFEGTVILQDVEEWKELRRFEHGMGLWSVDYSPTRRMAVTAGGKAEGTGLIGIICLWDLETGTELRRFEGHANGVWRAIFSPDGRRVLSASSDRSVRLWEVDSGQEVRSFNGHSGQVFAAAMTADGRRILSGGEDRTVRLWDAESGKEIHRFDGHTQMVRSVVISSDSQFALSGSLDGTVRLWRLPPIATASQAKKKE